MFHDTKQDFILTTTPSYCFFLMSLNVYQRIWTPFDKCPCFEPCITSVIDSYLVRRQQLSTTHRHWLYAWGLPSSKYEAFNDAAREGDIKTVQLLYEEEEEEDYFISLFALDDALLSASTGGQLPTIVYLLSLGDKKFDCIDRAFLQAAEHGHLDVTKYFVELGVDVNKQRNYYGFCKAAANGHLKVVQYLVSVGSVVTVENNYAVRNAAANGHLDVVQYLIDLGADIHADNDFAFRYACHYGHLHVVQYLVSNYHVDINLCDEEALHWAAISGHLDVVQYLVSQGAHVEICQKQSTSTIAQNGHLHILKFLRTWPGFSSDPFFDSVSLIHAAKAGHLDIVQYTVSQGVLSCQDYNQALKSAVTNGHLSVVQYFVSLGVNIVDHNYSLLKSAVINGHLDIVKYLVSLGVDYSQNNHAILMLAVFYDHLPIVKYLVSFLVFKNTHLISSARNSDLQTLIRYLGHQRLVHLALIEALEYNHIHIAMYLTNMLIS